MREIRFRAFHKPTKRMFEVYGFNDDFVYERTLDGVETSETNPAKREDCVLMQYTGVIDQNGDKIFDGDIINVITSDLANQEIEEEHTTIDGKHWISFIHRVNINYDGTCLIGDPYGEYGVTPLSSARKDFDFSYEVIGNIFEHPHLLEKPELVGGGE